jgi:hypothetical protein
VWGLFGFDCRGVIFTPFQGHIDGMKDFGVSTKGRLRNEVAIDFLFNSLTV